MTLFKNYVSLKLTKLIQLELATLTIETMTNYLFLSLLLH